jgi:hypothetical protein
MEGVAEAEAEAELVLNKNSFNMYFVKSRMGVENTNITSLCN